jgi:hypothetical protein
MTSVQTTADTTAGTEIWVYGSVARGTHSQSSDLDVLVVSDSDPDPLLVWAAVADLPQAHHLSVRRYSWREVAQMADYGSLFLLHLKLEGHLLHTTLRASGMSQMLRTLPAYRNDIRDIRGFLKALEDVRWALDDALDDDDILFELGVIATVIRHCSILACYKLGAPRFQMADSIRTSFAAVGMSGLAGAAIELYQFRLATARRISPATRPRMHEANTWLTRGQEYVEKVGEL